MKTNHTMTKADRYSGSDGFLSGGGNIGAEMRAKDWANTSLGPPAAWPQTLKTVVRIMLDSRYAMWMGWGPDLAFFYNDAYARDTLGKKHPWALGRPFREVWAEVWADLRPRIDHVLNSGEATWDNGLLLFLERSGYPEETYHTFSYSPLYDDNGQLGGVLCVVTEETERVIAERRVALLRNVASALTATKTEKDVFDAIAQCLKNDDRDLPFTLTCLFDDEDHRGRLVSSTGIDPAHPMAANSGAARWPLRDVFDMAATVEIDDLASRFADIPSGPWLKPPSRAILVPIAQQGQSRPAGVFIAGLNPHRPLDEGYRGFINLFVGQIASALANAHAYDKERRRSEALMELDRAKTTFFSNVSHEFRTPLTLMLGPLEDTISHANGILPKRAAEELSTVHRNGLRLLKLVNTLLDFSRIEAGRMQAAYEPTDLGKYTAELASVFRSAVERAGMKLTVNCPTLPEPVYVDRGMWEKTVLNLLSNAFKFTLQGEIEVTLRKTNDHVELSVRDTGCGIPEHELPRLFERFHRVEGTKGRTHEGTGIGLALVHELAKLHGGSVHAQSLLGQGSTFTVRLPLGRGHLPPDRIHDASTAATASLGSDSFVEEAKRWLPDAADVTALEEEEETLHATALAAGIKPRIVLADDNADMRQYVRRLLTARGFVVEAVADGEAALAAVQRQRPDLVLTDVMMPKLDGFGLLRAIRADPSLADISVLMLSARAGEEAAVEGLQAGADDYLTKPFSARELIAKIEARLSLAEAQRQRGRQIAQFETLLNEAPLGVYLVDGEFRIQHVNPIAAAAFGNIPDLIGRDLEEVLHILWPKDYAAEIIQLFRNTLETGETHEVAEQARIRLDRGIIEYYEWQINRIPLPDGRQGVVCYFRDISRHVFARQAVADAERKLRLMTDNAPVMIAHCDVDARYQFVNKPYAARFGLTPDEIIGKRIPDIVGEAAYASFEQYVNQAIAGQAVEFEGEIPYQNVGAMFMHIAYAPERDASGTVIGFVAVITNITERKRAEEALRERSELLDVAHDAVIARDFRGAITFWNHGAEEMYGYSKQEAIGSVPHDLLRTAFPTSRDEIEAHLLKAGRWEGELVHTTKDGRQLVVASRWVLQSGRSSQHARVMEINRDITERKRAEEQLRASEQRVRLAADAAELGIWVWDVVNDRAAWENDRPYDLFGLPRTEEPINAARFKSEFVHPDDVAEFERSVSEALQTGSRFYFLGRMRRRDGKIRWIEFTGRPVPAADGSPLRMHGTAADVTEKKLAEEQIRRAAESNAKFRTFFDQGTYFAGVMNLDGTLIEANRLCLDACGFSREEVVGKKFWDCGWWSRSPDLVKMIQEGTMEAAAGREFRRETKYFIADGSERFVELVLSPVSDESGRVLFIAPTGTDITEKKRMADERELLLQGERAARAEAERASRLKEDFLSTLSHELRTPLTAILGWTQILEKRNHDPQIVADGLAVIARNARAQTQLIEDLLDMSRITSGKLRLDVQRVDLSDVISVAVESLRPAAEAKEIRLVKVLGSVRTLVSGDPHRLQQVVWNLLSNSIKFTPKAGRVQVLLERVNSHVELSVTDNGQGISPAFLPHVFERFRQADPSTKRSFGGLGLGLAIVKQLVELHGGTVRVKSSGEGLGATFLVSLPLAVVHSPDAGREAASLSHVTETSPQISLDGVNVLVVDDESDARDIVKRILDSCKAEVTTAASVTEAMRAFKANRPDVILSDIGMPDQDGYELIRMLRSLPPEEGGLTPAAALTAYARPLDRRQALMAGYQSHVVKPADPAELVTVVASLAGKLRKPSHERSGPEDVVKLQSPQ